MTGVLEFFEFCCQRYKKNIYIYKSRNNKFIYKNADFAFQMSSSQYNNKNSNEDKYLKQFDNENELVQEKKKDPKLVITENTHGGYGSGICRELREYKLNETLALKRRQQLRANSHELRHLERQLQCAMVSKQLKEQQQSIAHLKEEELRKKREENAKFAAECELIGNSILEKEEREKQKKIVLQHMLKSQISKKQVERRLEFEIAQKERDKMEKLLKQIQAEKVAELKEAELLRDRTRREMEESFRNIKLKQQLEKQRNADDIGRYLLYQKECDNLRSQMITEKKLIQKEKESISERIGQELATINQEKEKRENLLLTLMVEEHKAKIDQDFRDSLIKKTNERDKFRNEFEKYRRQTQIEKEKQFIEEERHFQADRLRYLEERDKIDQLSDEKRRRKKIEHFRALTEMIEVRRHQKASEIAARIASFEEIINHEKKSDQEIKDERILMLSSVPKELLSYLPPGVLKTSDEEYLTLPRANM